MNYNMLDNSANNKRMAKNTLLMYIRMIILVLVQLYTVPIVLHTLGVEDYGIYNVVGGFVLMFTFVNGSLISGCQRFMAFAIGKNEEKELKDVFDTSVFIFVILTITLFIIIELAGLWFLNCKMTIPSERMIAANFVFQFALFSMVIVILSTPYNALVIAYERMAVFAYISIFEGIYKLLIAIILTFVLVDKLVLYSLLMFSSSFLVALFYFIYCRRHFHETKNLRLHGNAQLVKSIGAYAGWNVIGSLALVLRNHGLNIVMNLFFSPVMNAAHTVASQISGLFSQFVNNVYLATRPQMVKQYAVGNMKDMWNITFKSSKYAFFLMVYAAVPVLLELPSFLKIWLHEVPDYTVVFSRLIIISLMIETMTNQIIGAFQAANKIKYYQSVSSVILLGLLPLSYVSLNFLLEPILPYILYVIISLGYICSLLFVAYKQLGLDARSYIVNVIIKDLIVFIPSIVFSYYLVSLFPISYWRLLLTIFITIFITSLFIWFIGLEGSERLQIIKIISKYKIYGSSKNHC